MFNKYFNTTNKRILIVIIFFIGILLFSFSYYTLFHNYDISVPCFFHRITGLYCPGCGITRAIFALMEFNIKQAFRYNLLLFTVIPFLMYYFFKKVYYWIMMKDYNKKVFSNNLWNFLLFFTILFGIIRNFEFFSFLAP